MAVVSSHTYRLVKPLGHCVDGAVLVNAVDLRHPLMLCDAHVDNTMCLPRRSRYNVSP